MLNKTDEQLMLLIQNEDTRAFGILVKRYLSKVLAYADNMVGSASDDIVQETFESIWKSAHTFNPQKAKFSTWLYTILNNKCYNYVKKEYSIQREDFDNIADTLISEHKSAEESLIDKQHSDNINNLIKDLNPREQQAIILRYFEEKSNQETATIMNTSIKAIETLLNRARKKLKIQLSKNKGN
jgi:RNA polymerase sigma-70 factor (ECF subfamily)